jgi:hypothetical protein
MTLDMHTSRGELFDTSMKENDLKLIFNKLIDYAYDHKWHLYVAKGGQRQSNVLAHSLTVADLAVSLLDYVDKTNLKQNAQKRLLVAAFFHDCFKLSERFQKSITYEGKSDFTHIEPEKLLEIFRCNEDLVNSLGLTSSDINSIVAIYAFQGKKIESAIHFLGSTYSGTYGDEEFLSRVLTLADNLASKKMVSEVKNLKVDTLLEHCTLDYHEIAIVRGILTQILHSTIEEEAKNQGLIPILWYPEGTVYIGQKNFSLNISKIKKIFEEKVRKFIENANEVKLSSAVFGGIGQTIIKSPEILFSSDKSMKAFLEEMIKTYAKPSILQENPGEAVFNLLLIMKGVVKALCDKISLDEEYVVQKLKEDVVDPMNLGINVYQLKKFAHTLPHREKQKVVDAINASIKKYQSPQDFINNLKVYMLTFGNWCREQYTKNVKHDLIKDVSELIINEITHPLIFDKTYLEESYRAYVDGKSKGTPVCVFCNNKAEEELIASLVEEGGSESFINLLVGGSKIGGGNKAMICKVCELELMLRSLLAGGQFMFFIFPQFNISRNIFAISSEGLKKEKLDVTETISLSDLDALSRKITRQGVHVVRPFKLKELVFLREEKNSNKMRIIRRFVEKYEDIIKGYLVGNFSKKELEKMSSSDITEALINGTLKIDNKELHEELLDNLSKFEYVYQSGNYILFTTTINKGNYDTDDTFLIRKIYLALILSLVFQGIVYVQEFNETFIFKDIQGIVKYVPSLGMRDVEKYFGWKNGWVPISFSIEKSVEKLSSAFQIESYFIRVQQARKGFLLEIMREPVGKTLNKYVISTNRFSSELVQLLDKLAQEVDSHQQLVAKEMKNV